MSEANAQATPLSIANAVDSLLAAEAPVEETPPQPEVVAETDDEVEVEAAEETEEAEDILQSGELVDTCTHFNIHGHELTGMLVASSMT